MNASAIFALCCCSLLAACAPPSASPRADAAGAAGTAPADWRHYGNDAGGMRFSPLAQIHRGNVARLTRAWTYHTGELQGTRDSIRASGTRRAAFQATPLMIDGVLYFSTPTTRVVALDAETGRERWVFDPYAGRERERTAAPHRGVSYWEGRGTSGAIERRILVGTMDGRLIALDARTGAPAVEFGRGGAVDLRAGVTDVATGAYGVSSPPAIYRDLVITGSIVPEAASLGPSGDVRAFDVRTGALVWRFHTIPRDGEPGFETWAAGAARGRTGVNVWSMMTVDAERGLVFLPLGSASSDFYGGDRVGQGLYANSLVALDAATGQRRWHRQLVHHDVWDYDLPAPPALATIRRGGREIPVVVQVNKTGLMFVFDRVTGEPIHQIEERAVPQSGVPGESTWPTQPFPVKPAPLSRQTAVTEADLTDVTPESRAFCTAMFKRAAFSGGIFTPADTTLGIWFPGTLGGATWSGVSIDPRSGHAFVNVNEIGAIGMLRRRAAGATPAYERWSPMGAYARFWDDHDLPCQRPPWGRLHAVDIASGDIVWTVPLGVNDSLLARGVGKTGAPNIGGSIVTAGGLVFIASTNDRRLRAFDARTGDELWVTRLEASGHATPMTYRGPRTGRQFVVIAAGGGGSFSREQADVMAAYALPPEDAR